MEFARDPSDLRAADTAKQVRDEQNGGQRSEAETLLAITDAMNGNTMLPALFADLTTLLRELTGSAAVYFSIPETVDNTIRPRYLEPDREIGTPGTSLVDDERFDKSRSREAAVEQSPESWVWQHGEKLMLPNLDREMRFSNAANALRRRNIQSYLVLPLRTPNHNYGVLSIGWDRGETEDGIKVSTLERIAGSIAIAADSRKAQAEWREQHDRMQSLVAISRELSSTLDIDQLVPMVFSRMQQITKYDCACLRLLDADGRTLRIRAVDPPQDKLSQIRQGQQLPVAIAIAREAIETRSVTFHDAEDLSRFSNIVIEQTREARMQSLCCVPLLMGSRVLGTMDLGATRENAFSRADGEYLHQVATMIAGAIHNAGAYGAIERAKDRLTQEKRYLENEIREEHPLDEIIGSSSALKCVLDQAAIVADTDATVLITGETGTGKERVARAIHLMSSRRNGNFIKLNCAAIPMGLLESELFGHEKGAFTGAVSPKAGRLELADKGTLLLDEIGEIPLELQPKLLRVLQDQEFEHLGGTKTIRVNARILAASNRDLLKAVEAKEFRSDLFYRLNVFPLHLPPLRERHEDIPLLIRHFVFKCAARLNKRIDIIPDEAVQAMMDWTWPGNIRELENFIERSVILSVDHRLQPPLSELYRDKPRHSDDAARTLEERERDHVVEILRQTRGVLSGANGAAARLGIKRTTLQYKIQKLGITRTDYLD